MGGLGKDGGRKPGADEGFSHAGVGTPDDISRAHQVDPGFRRDGSVESGKKEVRGLAEEEATGAEKERHSRRRRRRVRASPNGSPAGPPITLLCAHSP